MPHTAQKSDVRVSRGGGGQGSPPGGPPDPWQGGFRVHFPCFPHMAVPLRVAVPQPALRSAGQQLPRVPLPLRLLHGDGAQRPRSLQHCHGQDPCHVPGVCVWGGVATGWSCGWGLLLGQGARCRGAASSPAAFPRNTWMPTCVTAMTASLSSCASTSSCASRPSWPSATSRLLTSKYLGTCPTLRARCSQPLFHPLLPAASGHRHLALEGASMYEQQKALSCTAPLPHQEHHQ